MSGARSVVVIGLALTGEAVVRRMRAEDRDVTVIEDRPAGAEYATRAAAARELGALVEEAPAGERAAALGASASLVVPSPLVTERHPAVVAARAAGVQVCSEIDLAAQRARVPIVAVTGTNGKTTVALLTGAMLEASGLRTSVAGNIGRTLLDAIDDDVDRIVAEVSSFQLAFADSFRPHVAVLLAVAQDHLDWHGDIEHYRWSKSRVFEHQGDDDLLVFDADDPVASALAEKALAQRVGVTIRPAAAGSFSIDDGSLRDADGRAFAEISCLRRSLPHDRTNALASAAAAFAAGATPAGVRRALEDFVTLPHRVALVGEADGVQYYDDSKATNPHATLHAVASFESVVLLAGGRNKGLDLGLLARESGRIRCVVAFGEAASEVVKAFAGHRLVVTAASMREAVRAAASSAEPGDVVLLSPACASFDSYTGYAARGDDFSAEVRSLIAAPSGHREGR